MMATIPAHIDVAEKDSGGLHRLLRRCARQQTPRYGVPVKPDRDGHNILRTLLEEVDETMLPRRLILECRPAGAVRILASNRRLSAIDFSDDAGPSHPPPPGPSELAQYYASALSQFFARCKEVTILPPERVEDAVSSDCSCSAQLVAEAAALDCFNDQNTQSFKSFYKAAKAVAQAWVEFDPSREKTAWDGSAEQVDCLEKTYRKLPGTDPASSHKSKFRIGAPECFIIPLTNRAHLIASTDRDAWFMALVPAAQAETLSQHWQSCRA